MHFARIVRDKVAELPTLSSAQAEDLKIDTGEWRLWQARGGTGDGFAEDQEITLERLVGGQWEPFTEKSARRVALVILSGTGHQDIAELAERYR